MSMKSKEETRMKILRAALKISKEKHDGFSSYDLERKGVSRRTFRDNEIILIEHDQLEITKKETRGKQERTYYKITTNGIFTIIKNSSFEDRIHLVGHYAKYIPLVDSHWNELNQIFAENELMLLFNVSIDNIDLLLMEITSNGKKYILNRKVIETRFYFDSPDFSLTFSKHFYTKPTKLQKKLRPEYARRYEKQKEIIDINGYFVFLFYFNLFTWLKSEHDVLQWIISSTGDFDVPNEYSAIQRERKIAQLDEIFENDPKLKETMSKKLTEENFDSTILQEFVRKFV